MTAIQLTPAQRKDKRADAHHLDPVVMIGGDGLTPAVQKEVDAALNAHGLIKVRVFSDERTTREAIFAALSDELGSVSRSALWSNNADNPWGSLQALAECALANYFSYSVIPDGADHNLCGRGAAAVYEHNKRNLSWPSESRLKRDALFISVTSMDDDNVVVKPWPAVLGNKDAGDLDRRSRQRRLATLLLRRTNAPERAVDRDVVADLQYAGDEERQTERARAKSRTCQDR